MKSLFFLILMTSSLYAGEHQSLNGVLLNPEMTIDNKDGARIGNNYLGHYNLKLSDTRDSISKPKEYLLQVDKKNGYVRKIIEAQKISNSEDHFTLVVTNFNKDGGMGDVTVCKTVGNDFTKEGKPYCITITKRICFEIDNKFKALLKNKGEVNRCLELIKKSDRFIKELNNPVFLDKEKENISKINKKLFQLSPLALAKSDLFGINTSTSSYLKEKTNSLSLIKLSEMNSRCRLMKKIKQRIEKKSPAILKRKYGQEK